MSEFENEIARKITVLREKIAAARAADNDFLAEKLVEELQYLKRIASDNDLDTSDIKAVIAAETGALPIIREAAPEA